jgi:hypothetical protein
MGQDCRVGGRARGRGRGNGEVLERDGGGIASVLVGFEEGLEEATVYGGDALPAAVLAVGRGRGEGDGSVSEGRRSRERSEGQELTLMLGYGSPPVIRV